MEKLNVVELTKWLIKKESVTPKECGIYEKIREILSDFCAVELEKEGVKNLFLYRRFGGHSADSSVKLGADLGADCASFVPDSAPHICFAGHVDVVPAGEKSAWSVDPFGAVEKDGLLFGRGAQDMKSGVAAAVCALRAFADAWDAKNSADSNAYGAESAMDSGVESTRKSSADSSVESAFNSTTDSAPNPALTLSLLLTSDEEGDGIYGTKIVLEHLKNRALLPTFGIIAEPSASHSTGDAIKIGRRGSINGKITIFGKQGHAAYPEQCVNPVELLGARLGDLAGATLDNGDTNFAPTRLVITDIRGGFEVSNVTPENLIIRFNVRNSPLSDEASVRNFVARALCGVPHTLEIAPVNAHPFVSDKAHPLISKMARAVESIAGKAPIFSTAGGTSDARFFALHNIPTCEVGVPNDKIHAADECVKIDDILKLEEIFKRFLD